MEPHPEGLLQHPRPENRLRDVPADKRPLPEHRHPVGTLQGQGNVMEHQHHGFALGSQFPGRVHDLQLPPDVQVGGGLVHKYRGGVLSQGHGQVYALPLAAAQGAHVLVFIGKAPRGLHGGAGNGIILPGVPPGVAAVGEAAMEHHFQRQDGGRVPALGEPGGPLGNFLRAELSDVPAVIENLPLHGGQDPQRRLHQRGFSTAVGPQERRHLPRREIQGYMVHHRLSQIPGGEISELNHGFPPLCRSSSHRKKGPPVKDSTIPTGSS